MESVARALRWTVETMLSWLDALPPWCSLAIIAAVSGLGMLIVVRFASPQRQITHARAQMTAALLEMRIYLDRPSRVFAAQGRMIGWTVAYLACLIPPALLLAAPLGLVYLHLEPRHGLAPFSAPEVAVLRVDLDGVAPRDVELSPSPGLAITARVRDDGEHALYARLAIRWPGTHHVDVRAGAARARKLVVADPGAAVVEPELRGGVAHLWSMGVEAPPSDTSIRAVSIRYPDRDGDVLFMPWWLYWLVVSSATALALRRRFDVVF